MIRIFIFHRLFDLGSKISRNRIASRAYVLFLLSIKGVLTITPFNKGFKSKAYNFFYYLHFSCFDLKNAIRCRLMALESLQNLSGDFKKIHLNAYRGYVQRSPKRRSHFIGDNHKSNSHVDSMLIIGPNFNLENNLFVDTAIVLKPFLPKKITSKNLILIINDSFYLESKDKVELWVAENQATLVRHNDLKLENFSFNASLMGLQRALFYVSTNFNVKDIYINGFDLNTSINMYKDNYPSLLPANNFKKKKKIHYSVARHDYLLNLYSTRALLNQINATIRGKDLMEILSKSDEEILDMLSRALK